MSNRYHLDGDALDAAVDVIGRTGAKAFEVGYARDGVPAEHAQWYAHAQYQGVRVMVENRRSPVDAAEALARRLLAGGRCTHCNGTITLSGPAGASICRWTRRGPRWERGCLDAPTSSAQPPKRPKRKRG